jgi:hypothetical protein
MRKATIPNYEKGFNRQDAKNAKAEVFADGHHLRAATTCGLPPLADCHHLRCATNVNGRRRQFQRCFIAVLIGRPLLSLHRHFDLQPVKTMLARKSGWV